MFIGPAPSGLVSEMAGWLDDDPNIYKLRFMVRNLSFACYKFPLSPQAHMVLFIGGLGVPVDVSAAVVLLLFFLLLLLLLLLFCRKRKLLAFWKPMSRYVHVCNTLLVIYM